MSKKTTKAATGTKAKSKTSTKGPRDAKASKSGKEKTAAGKERRYAREITGFVTLLGLVLVAVLAQFASEWVSAIKVRRIDAQPTPHVSSEEVIALASLDTGLPYTT